jgi:pilus assembly protein Flp/PilA
MFKFLLDEKGLELSEYAVAAALVAIAVTGAFTLLGDAIGTSLNQLAGRIQ